MIFGSYLKRDIIEEKVREEIDQKHQGAQTILKEKMLGYLGPFSFLKRDMRQIGTRCTQSLMAWKKWTGKIFTLFFLQCILKFIIII